MALKTKILFIYNAKGFSKIKMASLYDVSEIVTVLIYR